MENLDLDELDKRVEEMERKVAQIRSEFIRLRDMLSPKQCKESKKIQFFALEKSKI
jgi:hypothetical protein